MFGSEILDIALGLTLMFLLMSLVLTAVQESIESFLQSRSGDLNRALFELLQRDSQLLSKLYDHPLIFALHRGTPGFCRPIASSGGRETANYTSPVRMQRRDLPSYIPRETFAAALVDLLRSGETANEHLLRAYDSLNRITGGDAARVRREIESWYDGAMDRASGWFKRRTQMMLFGLGLATALLMNVNSLVVARHLATDEQARTYAASYADEVYKQGIPADAEAQALYDELEKRVGLPIGWSEASLGKLWQDFPGSRFDLNKWSSEAPTQAMLATLGLLAGYLVTAFAMMLGAPFWFDVLNRIMVIRSTVKPKEKSPDEPSEDGGKDKFSRDQVDRTGGSIPASGRSGSSGGQVDHDEHGEPGRAIDGCIADIELSDVETTDDVELPPATGGVERR